VCGTIKKTLKNKTTKDTQVKFYKAIATPMLMYGSGNLAQNRSERRKQQMHISG
jgi:hypothetical protein